MTRPISRNRLLGSLKEAASWPGADRNTVVTLATALVAARADAEGNRYFQDLSERNPGDITAQAARVVELFTDDGLYHNMAAAARRTAVERFATSLIIPQYEEYYRQVVSARA